MKIAGAVFLLLMTGHVGVALFHNRRTRRDPLQKAVWRPAVFAVFPFVLWVGRLAPRRTRWTHLMAALQATLFILGSYFGYKQGVFSRELVSPLAIGLGLLGGHIIFGISLLVTHRSIEDAASHFFDLGPLWAYVVDNPKVLTQFINVSIAEELIYRVGAQPLLIQWTGHATAGIVIVAIVFSLIHEHFFKNAAGQSAEFLAFALLLGCLYFWTGSLILVIVIHAVRNTEIAFIEHLIHEDLMASGEQTAAPEDAYLSGECLLVLLALPGANEPVCLEYHSEDSVGAAVAATPAPSRLGTCCARGEQ